MFIPIQEMAKRTGSEIADISLAKGDDVVHEMFYSMVREVRDEVRKTELIFQSKISEAQS